MSINLSARKTDRILYGLGRRRCRPIKFALEFAFTRLLLVVSVADSASAYSVFQNIQCVDRVPTLPPGGGEQLPYQAALELSSPQKSRTSADNQNKTRNAR